MKFIFSIIFLLITSVFAKAQQPYRYNLLNNKGFHSALRPYSDSIKQNSFANINPLYNISVGFGDDDQHALYMFNGGIDVKAAFKSKFTIDYKLYGSISRYCNYFANLADSLQYIPAGGHFTKKGDTYFSLYHDFKLKYQITNYLNIAVGKGRKFVGDGYRSLLLSDNNSGMYYFDITAGMGCFKYIFSVNTAKSYDTDFGSARTKYLVYHLFSYNITNYLNVGGLESVTIMRRDSLGNSQFVDLHYLNPVIFLRPLEYSLGSPDNVLLGVFSKIRFYRKNIFYFQMMLDEYNSSFLKGGSDWWAKKYALQIGVRGEVFNQWAYLFEGNYIRPFTYSHDNAIRSYSMFSQPLAHPYGANLKELVVKLRYNSNNQKWKSYLLVNVIKTGLDTDSISYGANILRPYTQRNGDYGHSMLQGKSLTITDFNYTLEYNLKLNFKSKSFFIKPFVTFGCYNNDEKCTYLLVGIKNFDLTLFY